MRDLEAVIGALKLKRFALLGMSEGGPIAMTYAARYPRRIAKLILYATFARRTEARSIDALAGLVRAEWGLASDALTSIFTPGASPDERGRLLRYAKAAANPEEAALMLEENARIDVLDLLPKITSPTLVIHARRDRAVPFDLGREIAGGIRGAMLVPLDTNSHALTPELTRDVARMATEFVLDRPIEEQAAEPLADGASVTLMFTDVEGSSALTDRLGDARAREAMRMHERITRDALHDHNGTEVKAIGDGFMASFSSATRALQCAIAIQQGLAVHNVDAPEPVRVRIGLNAGEPIAEQSDLFGSSVNLAARIAATASGGEIVVSNVVRELCTGKDFRFADRGEFIPKGFDNAVRVYELCWQP